MDMRLFLQAFVIVTAMAACSGLDNSIYGLKDSSSTATAGDMLNVLGDAAATRAYSRYLYRITQTDGSDGGSGIISMVQGGDENMKIVVTGGELQIIPGESFRRACNWETAGSDRLPFGGGYAAAGRLAIMPGLYTPVEYYPSWFPSNADVSVDRECNLSLKMKKGYESETQRLVAFMDARSKLEGSTCTILGTFDTVPQLRKMVTALRKEGKYNGERHYVLRLSWSSTFALVAITRGRERP